MHLEEHNHYHIKNGEIRLRIPVIYPIFKRWAQTYHYEVDLLDQMTFDKQLATESYFDANGAMRFGQENRTARGIRLSLEKVLEKDMQISDIWQNPPVVDEDSDETNIINMQNFKKQSDHTY